MRAGDDRLARLIDGRAHLEALLAADADPAGLARDAIVLDEDIRPDRTLRVETDRAISAARRAQIAAHLVAVPANDRARLAAFANRDREHIAAVLTNAIAAVSAARAAAAVSAATLRTQLTVVLLVVLTAAGALSAALALVCVRPSRLGGVRVYTVTATASAKIVSQSARNRAIP